MPVGRRRAFHEGSDGLVVATEVTDRLHQTGQGSRRRHQAGRVGREAALSRYGLDRFTDDWDRLLKEATR